MPTVDHHQPGEPIGPRRRGLPRQLGPEPVSDEHRPGDLQGIQYGRHRLVMQPAISADDNGPDRCDMQALT